MLATLVCIIVYTPAIQFSVNIVKLHILESTAVEIFVVHQKHIDNN